MLETAGSKRKVGGPRPRRAKPSSFPGLEVSTQILSGLALLCALQVGLLPSLLAGLLIYELVQVLTPRRLVSNRRTGKIVVVALLSALMIAVLAAGIFGLVSLLTGGPESLAILLRQMAEVLDAARPHLPEWAASYAPADPEELRTTASAWLRANATQLRGLGEEVWRALVHILIGMIIGGMIAVSRQIGDHEHGPLVQALTDRARLLGAAFRNVVFAQVRISALNTALTALYLVGFVPLLGVKLPLIKTMIAVTFIAGLLPVIGNLISNTVIVVVSLSASPVLAACSLAFLVLIHKLEYFVNARVMGRQIQARAWELLVAMLVMEAVFGLAGLVAAPVYYAYLKNELSSGDLM
jgi:predicted PurR-regulated permease PerM